VMENDRTGGNVGVTECDGAELRRKTSEMSEYDGLKYGT
jgi:hypothetical protein